MPNKLKSSKKLILLEMELQWPSVSKNEAPRNVPPRQPIGRLLSRKGIRKKEQSRCRDSTKMKKRCPLD